VTRAALLELAPRLGLRTREEPIGLAGVQRAGVMFLTSSLRLAVAAAVGPPPAETLPIARIRNALALF
jgi:branched-subunit amino acid aminotransferase/4-amino-4-deoxychorismate lyase